MNIGREEDYPLMDGLQKRVNIPRFQHAFTEIDIRENHELNQNIIKYISLIRRILILNYFI